MELQGRGSIHTREACERKYCRVWDLHQRANGKQHTKRFRGTYTQAIKELEKFRQELSKKIDNVDTFSAYADAWIKLRKTNPDLSPNTIKRDCAEVKVLQAMFDDLRLQDIKPSIIQAKMNERNGRSGTTMQHYFTRLNSIMNAAVDDDLIASNPCAKVKPPRRDTKERNALTRNELKLFLDKLDAMPLDGRVMACYFMAMQGLRRSEALGLLEEDVEDGITRIRRSLCEATLTLKEPKSAAGVRDLPQPRRLQAKIKEWRLKREELVYTGVFCCNTQGNILAPTNLYKWYRQKFADVGISLHELRHTNLTLMARELSLFGLKTWAGWSSIEPAKIYIHDDNQELLNAVARLDL